MGSRIDIGTRGRNSTTIGGSAGTPKYVGARAEVTRIPNVGVKIRLTDYKGTTEEVVAEAIENIVSNDNGSLTFTLPDRRTFTTDSLTGPMGPIGPEGPEGERGETGETGPQGETGNGIADAELNSDYTLTLDFTDGTSYTTPSIRGATGAQGVQGPQGERGLQGEKGDPGEAFSIIKTYSSVEEMNADYSGTDVEIGQYVMITSTVEDPDNAKVYIKGSQAYQFVVDMSGATGVKGDKGDKGETGPQGPQGPQGIQGIQGIQGEKGETGPAGPQGEKGDKGDTGDPTKVSDLENDLRFIKAVDTASGAIATFKDAFIKKLTAQINPIQDLHGYDKPWAGGNGKNKLPLVLDDIKASNTQGTWNANSYTRNGLTFKVNADADGNITDITVTGTATSTTVLRIDGATGFSTGTFALNGCPSGGNTSTTYCVRAYKSGNTLASDTGSGTTFTDLGTATNTYIGLLIWNGYNCGSGVVFKPMVRSASETDASFEPYSNICPISGWDEAKVTRTGKNFLYVKPNVSNTASGISVTTNSDGSITISGTASATTILISNLGAGKTASTSVQNDGEKWIPNGTYYVSSGSTDVSLQVLGSNRPAGDISDRMTLFAATSGTVTIDDSYSHNWVRLLVESGKSLGTGVTIKPFICPNSEQDKTWQPFGNTFIIDLGGTRYGGTLDVTSGVMNVTHVGMTFDTADNQGVMNNSYYAFKTNAGTGITRESYAKLLCDKYACARSEPERINGTVYAINGQVIFVDDRFTSLANAQSVLASEKPFVVYPLATPITVQLTPTQIEALVGENNVWASTGEVELELVGVPEMADKIPFAPTSDGTYTLKVTITDGEAAYSWVADA